MSLQGPIVVVADGPAADVTDALSAAGAFPIIETTWSDAPNAFVSVNPAAVVIADFHAPESESARMLDLQIATASGPIVPVIARAESGQDSAVPVALPVDARLPMARLVGRLHSALRVRALHATVLRRIETFAAQGGALPELPTHDALKDATVLILGRGPLYPTLSVAIGERVSMVGAFSVEAAATHLDARDIDGVVVGDGFSPRRVEAFLTCLAEEPRFRDIPVAVVGEGTPDFAETLSNIDHIDGDPVRLVPRMLPLVRMHAFEVRLKRMLKSLDANGMFDPDTGLLTHDAFGRDLTTAIAQAAERSLPLSIARFSFDGGYDARASFDAARLVTRLVRDIDFATRDEDGAIFIVFTQTDLRHAHVVVRRIAGALRNHMLAAYRPQEKITANITLATLKNGDTIDSLLMRIMGHQVVAAE
jgi:hypothetical protein